MNGSETIDGALADLRDSDALPPPSAELRAALGSIEPVATRRPRRQFLLLLMAGAIYGAGIIAVLGIRRDFAELPRLWLGLYIGAWTLGFVSLAWVGLVPVAGSMLPRSRMAGIGAAALASIFTVAGVALARHVPGLSTMYEPTVGSVLRYGHFCLELGLLTALVPIGLAILFLRRALPVGSRWAAAGLGAAGGSLGGLVLHIYCPIAERFHLGLIHGGVVLLSAIVAALLAPRFTRP